MLKAKLHRSSMFSATPAEQSLVMELLSCRLTEITQQCSHFSDHTGHSPLLMTHVCPGRVRSWIRLRTAKPQPSLPGPSLDLHNSPTQRASKRLQWHHTSQEHSLNLDDLSRVLSSPMWTHGEEQDRMFWGRGQFCHHLLIRHTSQVTQASACWKKKYRKSV